MTSTFTKADKIKWTIIGITMILLIRSMYQDLHPQSLQENVLFC